MSDHKLYLAQLPDENQKQIRRCSKLVSGILLQAQRRLDTYASENAESNKDTVFKTLENLKEAVAISEGMLSLLTQAHGLPEELGLVTDEDRKAFNDLLTSTS